MKITKATRYITNGQIIIRLGLFSPKRDRYDSESFYMCTDYPKGTGAHYLNGSAGRIPWFWLQKGGYMKDFISIQKKLIPAKALKVLDA